MKMGNCSSSVSTSCVVSSSFDFRSQPNSDLVDLAVDRLILPGLSIVLGKAPGQRCSGEVIGASPVLIRLPAPYVIQFRGVI